MPIYLSTWAPLTASCDSWLRVVVWFNLLKLLCTNSLSTYLKNWLWVTDSLLFAAGRWPDWPSTLPCFNILCKFLSCACDCVRFLLSSWTLYNCFKSYAFKVCTTRLQDWGSRLLWPPIIDLFIDIALWRSGELYIIDLFTFLLALVGIWNGSKTSMLCMRVMSAYVCRFSLSIFYLCFNIDLGMLGIVPLLDRVPWRGLSNSLLGLGRGGFCCCEYCDIVVWLAVVFILIIGI